MMATESPVRTAENRGATNWKPPKGVAAVFSSQPHNNNNNNNKVADEELEALLSRQRYRGGDERNMAPNPNPNRSGSAPPSIEGSFGGAAAYSSSNFNKSSHSLETEEQMRADPAYIAYYYSNVNLNPRLPPPLTKTGDNWRLTSNDDTVEEPEDDNRVITPGYDDASSSLDAHHKSLVDLIQQDFPRTPSPLYNLSHSSNHATTVDEGIARGVQSISLENLILKASKLSDSSSGSTFKEEGPLATTCLPIGSNPDTITDAPGSLQDVQSRNENTPAPHPGVVAYQVQSKISLPSPAQVSQQQQHYPQSPLFAPAAAYMTTSGDLPPFSPGGSHLPSASLYGATAPPPQYGGGYALNNSAFIPPFVPGYSTVGVHMQYDPAAAAAIFSSGEAIPHAAGDLLQQQHVNKFYDRQQGMSPLQMQPSFADPLQMQYFQQQSVGQDAYGSQYGWFASFGGQDSGYSSFSSSRQASINGYGHRGSSTSSSSNRSNDHMFLAATNVRSAPMTQFWAASPFGSPISPASPVSRRNEFRLGQRGSDRNLGTYDTGWQGGQRGLDSLSVSQKKHSILDELKSCIARKIDLSDISGRVIEFSVDQHGSRFIQQKLENCKVEERQSVFREVLPHVPKLMTDVFGNYVVQKLFEHGSREQRKQLVDQLSGQILPLTFQMYGCRVIQKALEVIELDQKTELVRELDGHVLRCVRDQNGNHVIQKCIESIPTEKIGFIISSFQGQVANLSTHPYGCRVIQRILEHCGDELQSQCIVDEILESAHILVLDQYGNYVTQHVLQRGKPHERSQIISKMSGKIVQMSQHKYASNVVEKCFEHGDVAERERLIDEILGQSEENNNLLAMMKDQFANYVVQKILEISNEKQREVLLHRINVNLQALRKYTYGKHIVARFEQLCGEESDGSG